MQYINEFLGLKCVADVMASVGSLGKNAAKEITESMAVIKRARSIFLDSTYTTPITVYDLCAGNALTSVLISFLFKVDHVYAIDKKPRERRWELINSFTYLTKDINNIDEESVEKDSLIIAVHPCSKLATHVCTLYNKSAAKYLIMLPCCVGSMPDIGSRYPHIVREKVSKYTLWSLCLAEKVNGNVHEDKKCLSPANHVITATKEEVI